MDFVATSCCGCGKKYDLLLLVFDGHGKKYDLLPFFVDLWGHGKKYDLLWGHGKCRGMPRTTICCL